MAGIGNTSRTVIGTTPQQIAANFSNNIAKNLATAKSPTLALSRLSAGELDDLAYTWARINNGNLTRLASIIKQYAPTQVARYTIAANNATVGFTNAGSMQHIQMYVQGTPYPTVDMTLEEIYLEYRTATVGSLSVEGAIFETGVYAGGLGSLVFGAASAVGAGMSWLVEHFMPTLDAAINQTLFNFIWSFNETVNPIGIGMQEDRLASYMDGYVDGIHEYDFYDGLGDLGDFGTLNDWTDIVNVCTNPGQC